MVRTVLLSSQNCHAVKFIFVVKTVTPQGHRIYNRIMVITHMRILLPLISAYKHWKLFADLSFGVHKIRLSSKANVPSVFLNLTIPDTCFKTFSLFEAIIHVSFFKSLRLLHHKLLTIQVLFLISPIKKNVEWYTVLYIYTLFVKTRTRETDLISSFKSI